MIGTAPRRFSIAIVGGTGAEGSGLALRLAAAGHRVAIASRDPGKARDAAAAMAAEHGVGGLRGGSAEDAVADAEVVVLAVPFAAQRATAGALKEALRGKVLVDVTVPLVPPKVSEVRLPEGGSCVAALQDELGPEVRVVAAFQNVSAHKLKVPGQAIDCDVLVCGDDREARQLVVQLACDAGLRGIEAGPLRNAAAVEALTSVLIWINRAYKVPDAGVRITGLPAGAG